MTVERREATHRHPHDSSGNLLDTTLFDQSGTDLGVSRERLMVEMLAACFGDRFDAIDTKLDLLLENVAANARVKDWYTPEEFGAVVGKTRYTVSEWCRLERINAEKAESGRGRNREWRISHDELKRYEREGLLPVKYPGM